MDYTIISDMSIFLHGNNYGVFTYCYIILDKNYDRVGTVVRSEKLDLIVPKAVKSNSQYMTAFGAEATAIISAVHEIHCIIQKNSSRNELAIEVVTDSMTVAGRINKKVISKFSHIPNHSTLFLYWNNMKVTVCTAAYKDPSSNKLSFFEALHNECHSRARGHYNAVLFERNPRVHFEFYCDSEGNPYGERTVKNYTYDMFDLNS